MTATTRILDFAAAAHRLSPSVADDTRRLVADTLAVAAAGTGAPGYEGVVAVARQWGMGSEARLIGREDRLPAGAAAYVNCFAAHALEWDAVHEGAVVHAMTAVVPAVMAVLDRRAANGLPRTEEADVLAAIAVGVDVAAGLGLAATSALSFFRPAVTGVYGAALAVARIEGLPQALFADVLGMAHAHAAGTMQAHTEGSIALPLQFANAARSAVHAVDLVRHGLTAAHDVLDGPFGHFSLFDRGAAATYADRIGAPWLIGEISTKPFPSGRASHAALAALRPFAGRDVAAVEVQVPPLIAHLVGRVAHVGMAASHARLCLPFLAAMMLRDGAIDPLRFDPDGLSDAALLALAENLTVVVDGNPDPNAMSPQRVIVTMADGTVHDIAVPATLGSPQAPLDPAAQQAKREQCRALAPDATDPRLFAAPIDYLLDRT